MTDVSRYRRTATEEEMRGAITEAVEHQGGRVFYINDSRRTPEMADWVDLVLVLPRRGVVALVELKSARRQVTPGQAALMADLEACHRMEAWVVRAGEGRAGEIEYDDLMRWLEGGSS